MWTYLSASGRFGNFMATGSHSRTVLASRTRRAILPRSLTPVSGPAPAALLAPHPPVGELFRPRRHQAAVVPDELDGWHRAAGREVVRDHLGQRIGVRGGGCRCGLD